MEGLQSTFSRRDRGKIGLVTLLPMFQRNPNFVGLSQLVTGHRPPQTQWIARVSFEALMGYGRKGFGLALCEPCVLEG
jgi:hypothetical protein